MEDRKAAYIANDIGITYTFPNEIYTVDIGGQTYYVMEVNATAQDGEYTEYFVVRRQGDYMIVLHFYGKTRTLDDYLAMVS